ncbi:hypothetical protein Molly5_173 [Maribacter phage Molly_5]|uniref:Uncharacterized protein n=1 Tax=Maribacter phage Molly_1 TaxID=2745685 RepID=A0A8E4XZT8_9CAUD|nr:hypothetical protein M1M29_gp173 [Maribacter phage Molly_1]QQO97670.1 hypothetical protein Molly2_173 [Maribacter phage Molly_2]QQO97870.1 hypothetical protein Molly3_173 [Maribacter phage Molly_3]QQO98070.1 hypothetical protein Molly4_173 [Maribacter phage Molly_4]QQO98270.1 hypothetical protein Molly5_173 [Maribacter phage Molly_5]QQO97470.1 hypothetical protein Molly1_173 [Maribacter phage Molly_1]
MIKRIKRYLQAKRLGIKSTVSNVWYNSEAHSTTEPFLHVFSGGPNNDQYVDCEVGNVMRYSKLPNGQYAYYEITKAWKHRPNSDWLYQSDCINVNLKFSHVK